jgi:hypothetical protein
VLLKLGSRKIAKSCSGERVVATFRIGFSSETTVASTRTREDGLSTLSTRRTKVRKSHLGAMLAALAAGSAATVTALDSWDKVLVEFGLKKSESAVLAEEGAQGDLLRQMTRLLSQRVFWTERYSGDVADGFPKEDQDDAWKRYNESVVVWNENYMLNAMLTEKYFTEESKKQLADLNWLLRQVNTCLNKIHYPELYKDKDATCHFDGANGGAEKDNIRILQNALTQVDAKFSSLAVLLAK